MTLIKELHQNTRNMSLLYVEDDEQLRLQMNSMFQEIFKHVDLAENGELGLAKYKEWLETEKTPYDLVITDINMPQMNGIEMTKAIYEINPLQPVVVVSAHNESDYLIELLRIGVSNFLIKPIQHDMLVTTLYKATQVIINERLIKSHYKQIEKLNAELAVQSEQLRQSNEALKEKNIAIEKSMRIIEGMQHKNQLNRTMQPIPSRMTNARENGMKKETSVNPPSALKKVEQVIDNIACEFHYKGLKESQLAVLSETLNTYVDSLPQKPSYTPLRNALRELSSTISKRPECSNIEDLERIFCRLESFFFIYSKFQNEWSSIDDSNFEGLCQSIANEISSLIDIWQCKH